MGLATIDPHSQKEHTEIHKFPSLVLIRLVLTEIQRFKKSKLTKKCMASGRCVGMAIHFFVNFDVSDGCILLTIGSIYTKLGDFVKLGLHVLTMWINSC